jgi:hypothetical protein
MPRADGPFKVLEKINENAYKLDLPANFGVSLTFNIADLKSYLGEEDELESRTTQMQEGEDDVDINMRFSTWMFPWVRISTSSRAMSSNIRV